MKQLRLLREPRTAALGLFAIATLLAPPARSQVPVGACGVPPQPILGTMTFQDITTQIGYQTLQAPTSDTMSDYTGGNGEECEVDDNYNEMSTGPWATPELAATVVLPFPFAFSGIYSDGGPLSTPFQVNVWANGILTFDPSVSFNPFAYPLQDVPADCTVGDEFFGGPTSDAGIANGTVADTLGGFPFLPKYGPPAAPSALIAPWWGDLSLCPGNGSVGWLLTLDDNNLPMAVFQWTKATASPPAPNQQNCDPPFDDCTGDFSSCTDESQQPLYPGATLPQFTFQVRLHQNNDVDFIYGPSSYLNNPACFQQAVGSCTYVSGIQSNFVFPPPTPVDLGYAVQSFSCGTNVEGVGCNPNQFPAANTSVTYHDVFRSVGPDVEVAGISPPGLLPQGGTVSVPVLLSNGGGDVSAGEGQLQFYFSTGGNTPEGSPFSAQGIQSLAPFRACKTQSFSAQVAIPAGIAPGPGYLIAEFIPGAESVDQTPSYASAAAVVGPPAPDLAVVGSLGFSPLAVVDGQQLSFIFTVANVAESNTPATAYGIYVSHGGAISSSDIQIGGDTVPALTAGQSMKLTPSFTVPLTLVSGTYLIGVIVDPENTLGEVNLSNNIAVGQKLVTVTSLGPVIATTSLPKAYVSAPYSTTLVAGGGDGTYQWSLAGGTLPSGLALSSAGIISGAPSSVGTSSFTVKVTDGPGQSVTQALELEVDPFQQALNIVTQALPGGATGRLYDFKLTAVGGVPPYQWALVPGMGDLPDGVNLVSDGTLSGEPQYDESASFRVTVTDSAGTVVTSPIYSLTVYSGGALAVASTSLPEATLGQNYGPATLRYSGGSGPYQWVINDIEQEPLSPGDTGIDLGAGGLQRLGLSFDPGGVIGGVPTEVGVFAISVQVTDSESPAATAVGLVLLTVTATTDFQFLTVQLPPATANAPYSTTLATNAAANDNLVFEALNDAQQPTVLAKSTLPPGLTLYPDGQIQGVPLETGTFAFLVEARDTTTGGVATQSFSIQILGDATAASGCQSASGAPALVALLLLAVFRIKPGTKRRRHSGRR